MSRFLITLIYACFFLSGAAGLIYEVVWARQLGLFLGITGFAHTAVITAYMAGLAAGSWYFGRRADEVKSPLRIYAWLEIGVALYAAVTPWLFTALQSAYASIVGTAGVVGTTGHLARIAIALAALLIPTFLMGGTLPLLVRGVAGTFSHLGKTTSRLYGINTLGAMTGTLLAGFVLIRQFGITATIFTGVVINLAIAALVLRFLPVVSEQAAHNVEEADTGIAAQSGPRIILIIGFGAAGFAALLTQLAWIRALVLAVGGSVYAFTIALACFLAGIGMGSLAYNWIFPAATRMAPLARLPQAAVVAGLVGFTILAGIPLLALLPEWFLAGYAAGLKDNFAQFQAYIFGLAFALMFLPTLFMGVLFPLVTVIWTRHFARAGRAVGTAYAVNTAGTILGALLGGLLIVPWLGIQHSLVLAAAIYVAVAVAFWLGGTMSLTAPRRSGLPVISLVIFLAGVWCLPPWDSIVWGNGVYYRPEYTIEGMKEMSLHDVMAQNRLLYYEEGIDGTVAVSADEDQKYLLINGKTDASSVGDLQTQLLLGHVPVLFHRQPKNVLIIGLGSGITAGAVAAHESIENITVLEILPEVVEASEFFVEENQHVLQDRRVELVSADARNYILAADQTWDIIISEPSNPWISGISNLFTRDFFQLARQQLAPGGIMTQWFHAYNMSVGDMKSVLRTFSESFAYVTVWHSQLGDILLVGADTPYELNLQRFEQAQANEKVGKDLLRANMFSARDLARLHLLSGEQLKSYVAGAQLNTDDEPLIEFSAPRNLYARTTRANMISIATHMSRQPIILPFTGLAKPSERGVDVQAMELDLVFPDRSAVSDVLARWLAWREPQIVDGEDYFGIGSSRQVQWRELGVAHGLRAVQVEQQPTDEEMDQLLFSNLRQAPAEKGAISMHGGHQGRWLLTAGVPDIELGIVWACPSKAGAFNRFFTYIRLPDPGRQFWGDELVRLAAHYRCKLPPKPS